MSTNNRFTVAEKKASNSHRLWEQGDKITSRRANRRGVVMGVYGDYVWVLWEDAAEQCGYWMPETEHGSELDYVGPPTPNSNMFS